MTHIEEILSRALLVRDRSVPRDIVPPAKATYPDRDPAVPIPMSGTTTPVSSTAAKDLRALCETLVTHAPANDVADFVTEQVPEPRSAMILACVLQLTDTDDGARYWWQYAWGAGQSAAAYCLYLHHLSQGEAHLAAWWHRHTDDARTEAPPGSDPSPEPAQTWHPANQQVTKASTATMLRVLQHLAKHTTRTYSAVLVELMDYIPTAVASGYLRQPDWEMPLPGPDFSARVAHLLDAATKQPDIRRPSLPARTPSRTPHPTPTAQRPAPEGPPEPHAVSPGIRNTAAR